jgi:hypothetical protein
LSHHWSDELRALGLPDDALLVDLLIEEAGEYAAGDVPSRRAYELARRWGIPGECVSKVLYYLRQKAHAKRAEGR